MKDILRLGRYLRPYKGRILMAVAASFVSTVFLGSFWYLAPAIIQETLSPSAKGVRIGGPVDAARAAPEASAPSASSADSPAPRRPPRRRRPARHL
jgi:hypothetical protein